MTSPTTETQLISTFTSLCERTGLAQRKRESLLVPYFPTDFNRCMEHRHLNHMINTPFDNIDKPGWYQVTTAARTNDMRKVDSGFHSTVFELLVSVRGFPNEQLTESIYELTEAIREFLINELSLDPTRLGANYFGGGEVLPGVYISPDAAWRNEWLRIGIPESNLFPFRGPKAYILMVNDLERCGPTCEILYRVDLNGRHRWVEIGTAIVHAWQLHQPTSQDENWRVIRSKSIVTGVAYGLSRLMIAASKVRDISQTPLIARLLQLTYPRIRQPVPTKDLLHGDVLIFIDQITSLLFLLADGAVPSDDSRGSLLNVMLRRIRRKCVSLDLEEWRNTVQMIEEVLLDEYRERYPALQQIRGRLLELLEAVKSPEFWTPDSYDPSQIWTDG